MTFMETLKQGKKVDDIEIYDAHAHLGKWFSITMRESEKENLADIASKMNFQKMVISSSLSICSDFKEGNNQMVDAIETYPDQLLGYITLNANYKDGLLEEIKRLDENKNIVGLKIHPSYSGVKPSNEKYYDSYAYAGETDKIILVHTFNEADVYDLSKVFEKFKNTKFIIGHSGAEDGVELAAKMIKAYSNVYCDIPVSFAPNNTVEYLVNNGDENKIFFGTDAPLFDYRVSYGRVLFSNISENAKKKIMGLNFKNAINYERKG